MTTAPSTVRAAADRCPGVLAPHRAADGALLRLRVPGGRVPAGALQVLGRAAARYADGDIQLTSRANVQLRGVATDAAGAVAGALVDLVVGAGFLPQPSHERVRNIVCSPLSGLAGGVADLRPLTRRLDELLCGEAELAGLPGPFLFVLDDGRGDVAGLPGDLGILAVSSGTVRLRVGDLLAGPVVPIEVAAAALIDLARRFLPLTRNGGSRAVWHVRELPDQGRELLPVSWPVEPLPRVSGGSVPIGPLTKDDGSRVLSVLVPLGLLTGPQSDALVEVAGSGSGELVVTPWRGVLVPGLPAADVDALTGRLTGAGLELSADSGWRGITACTGAPRCAHGQGETRPLATAVAELRRTAGRPSTVHVVGCERRCGSPRSSHVELLNLGASVRISRDGVVTELAPADAVAAFGGPR